MSNYQKTPFSCFADKVVFFYRSEDKTIGLQSPIVPVTHEITFNFPGCPAYSADEKTVDKS